MRRFIIALTVTAGMFSPATAQAPAPDAQFFELFARTSANRQRCEIIWPQHDLIAHAADAGLFSKEFLDLTEILGFHGTKAGLYVNGTPEQRKAFDEIIGIFKVIRGEGGECPQVVQALREGWSDFRSEHPDILKDEVHLWVRTDYETYNAEDVRNLGMAKYVIDACWNSGEQRLYSEAYESVKIFYEPKAKRDKFFKIDFEKGLLDARDAYGSMTKDSCRDVADDLFVLGAQLLR